MRPDIKAGLDRYRDDHVPTGGFLRHVLENDLFGAFAKADEGNQCDMLSILQYIHNNLPIGCYGSPEQVKEWLEMDVVKKANIKRLREVTEE